MAYGLVRGSICLRRDPSAFAGYDGDMPRARRSKLTILRRDVDEARDLVEGLGELWATAKRVAERILPKAKASASAVVIDATLIPCATCGQESCRCPR